MSSPSGSGPTTLKLQDLSGQQLSQLKKQLDEELSHLSNSFNQLRLAQQKFRDCAASLAQALDPKTADRTILVPLTSSLYVPGKLADREKVIVDVGTGFFVEKDREEATRFYDGKIKELGDNLGKLEGVVRQKSEGVAAVEEVLRQKIMQANNSGETDATAS